MAAWWQIVNYYNSAIYDLSLGNQINSLTLPWLGGWKISFHQTWIIRELYVDWGKGICFCLEHCRTRTNRNCYDGKKKHGIQLDVSYTYGPGLTVMHGMNQLLKLVGCIAWNTPSFWAVYIYIYIYIYIHTYTVGDTSRPRNALRVGPALLRKHAGPAVKSSPGPSPAHGHTERINPGGRNMVVKYSTYVGSNMISIDIHNINIYLYTEIIILWVLGIMC